MRKYAILLLVVLVALLGCAPQPSVLVVTLESPANGSTVNSLTPILAWGCSEAGASYRIQVATNSNFQNLIIDASALSAPSYAVPSGKLSNGQAYYWRVNASKGSKTSDWSTCWSFETPAAPTTTGTMVVNATLEGSAWSGQVNYNITGPEARSGSSVSQSFSDLAVGAYTVTYSSGGPAGATLTSITPSPTQTLSAGGTITFSLNFHMQPASAIVVNATLDGASWSGQVRYSIHGPYADSHTSVPQTFTSLPAGTYTLSYRSGGPSGATLASITPQPTQTLSAGGTIYFSLNFHSQVTGTITVGATLDGSTWSGLVNYTIHGPEVDSGCAVPDNLSNLPGGTYTLSYSSGGPSGAILGSITPSPTQTLSSGGFADFTMNFHSQATGTIYVNATLDGSPWETAVGSGSIHYTVHGPYTDSSSTVPDSFSNLPTGTYTLSYESGGPIGATLGSITPSPRQNLSPGGSITFTMNFHSQATGTVLVNATVNGAPWTGAVRYTLAGPYVDSSGTVPDSFSGCPAGSYTLSYTSGGPEQTVLYGITPSPTQSLSSGGTITFTMEFVGVLTD